MNLITKFKYLPAVYRVRVAIGDRLWLSSYSPGSTRGHKLVILINKKYYRVPFFQNVNDRSGRAEFLANWLFTIPEY